jgi:hypothetical protein
VEQHDRRAPEALAEQEAQRGRVDERQVEVRVAQAGVELDGHVLAGRLFDRDGDEVVKKRLRLDPDAALGEPRGPRLLRTARALISKLDSGKKPAKRTRTTR